MSINIATSNTEGDAVLASLAERIPLRLPFINLSAPPYNLVGDGVTDNSAAFDAILAALPDQVCVTFGRGTFVFSAQHTISKQYFRLFGVGRFGTYLKYTGGAGTFLKFQDAGDPNQYGLHLEDFAITATNTTASKVAIELVDTRTTELKNIGITAWSGGDSVGLQVRGRELLRVTRCQFGGGSGAGKLVPVRLSQNPNTTPTGWLSADVFRFEHCLMIPTTATDTLPHAGIVIDDQCQVNKTDFQGLVVAGGKYGIYWDAPTAVTGHVSDSLNIKNFRKEQTPAAATGAYAIYINLPDENLSNLLIEDFTGENSVSQPSNGIYVRGVVNLSLRNITQYGGVVNAFDVDAEVVSLEGLETASTATYTLGTNMRLSRASHTDRLLPVSALWTKQSSFRNLHRPAQRIGDISVANYWFDMSDDTTAVLPFNADSMFVAGGIVEIFAYNQASTLVSYGMFGLSQGNIGTNGVDVLLDPKTNCAAADTDTKMCLYATGASPLYSQVTVKNRLGSTAKVMVMARYYRTANS